MRKLWNRIPPEHRYAIAKMAYWASLIFGAVAGTVLFLWLVGPLGVFILPVLGALAAVYLQLVHEGRQR